MDRQKLDKNNPINQHKAILSDWKPSFLSKDWWAKRLLRKSGGGAPEHERGTVKPVQRKTP